VAESMAHAGHDLLRVAEAVDRAAPRASVLDFCGPCSALFADLVALTSALPLAALPARSREFTLTTDDARRLRPGGWRAWWSILGSARDVVSRPLAISFTTLGLAGLLLTAAPSFLPMAASAPATESVLPDTVMITKVPGTQGGMGDVPVSQDEAGSVPPFLPWLGLLAVGGGLFAVRRVAGYRRTVR